MSKNNSPNVDAAIVFESLGDDLEGIHAALSKRGNIRKSFSSSKMRPVYTNGRSSISDASKDSEEDRKQSRASRLRERQKSGRVSASEEDSDSKNSNYTDEERRRRQRRAERRKSAKTTPINRSDSTIEKLLEYNENANHSAAGSNATKRKPKSSMNPLMVALSKSRDSQVERVKRSSSRRRRSSRSREPRQRASKSLERRASKSRERRRSKSGEPHRSSSRVRLRKEKQRDRSKSVRRSSSSKNGRKYVDDEDDSPRTQQKVKRSVSSNSRHLSSNARMLGLGSSSSHQFKDTKDMLRNAKSLRVSRSFMSSDEHKKEDGTKKDTFERLWGDKATTKSKTVTKEDLNSTNNSYQSNSNNEFDSSESTSRRGVTTYGQLGSTTPVKGKKTKLEKIHELQGQVDIFRNELETMTGERDKYERELRDSRDQIASIQKLVNVHEGQSEKLQKRLALAEEELESKRIEQRTELSNFSDAAKELAKVNIDYAKSVDEARIMKEELIGLKATLAEKEEKIRVLEKDLKASNENLEHLEADVLYADDQIGKLEAQIKKLEEEVALYSEAADKDGSEENDGTNHLQEAKYEAERRKIEQQETELEERSRALEEKNRLLEEEMKEFERQKLEYLEEQNLKEAEFEEKRARDEEERVKREKEIKHSDEDRTRKEDELNQLVAELRDENTALNGKLKSEQLDSTMKLQNKEKAISQLEAEVSKLTEEKQRRDSAPDSSPSLMIEIENLKTEAIRRHSDFECIQVKKVELEDAIQSLRKESAETKKRLAEVESEAAESKKESENQRKRTLEWQKKTGEWSEKAVIWKQRSENWEKKAKELSGNDNASAASDEAAAVAVDPQALFLAAAVEKRAANVSAANANGSWRLGRRIFGMPSVDADDETQALINKLEGENSLKENEIRALKSEMVKMQTSYKEQAYSKTQVCEQLKKEMAAIELQNTNLLKELELARKLNRTMAESDV